MPFPASEGCTGRTPLRSAGALTLCDVDTTTRSWRFVGSRPARVTLERRSTDLRPRMCDDVVSSDQCADGREIKIAAASGLEPRGG